MFQNACKALVSTVMPIVVARRFENRKLDAGIGAGIVVNADGWFVTAGHILMEIAALEQQVSNPKSYHGLKGKRPTHYVAMFGKTNAKLSKGLVQQEVDLGVGKLEGYQPPNEYVFPQLREYTVQQGELLCRIGFPFVDNNIGISWTKAKGFTFTNLFPVPTFVNEALVSRFGKLKTGLGIETSSPGLKGQSGGPLIDTDGLICGIQVNTHHYPLGFKGSGRNQVLNVGRAVHVETVKAFLNENGIAHDTEGT